MDEEAAVTRSVEIPEEAEVAATEAALAAGFVDPDDGTIPQWLGDGKPPVWTHPSEAVKLILAAALPYLAPAGDGGLREALEKLAAEYSTELGTVSCQWLSEKTLKPLLAAHPAAPAVPQPVDREALTQALLRVWLGRIKDQVADSPEGHCAALADAVLAVLAGEQEQVESPE